MEVLFFWVLAILIVASSLMVLVARNAIHSAVSLVLSFFLLGGIYVMLAAHFLAIIQILVYAGAIMVLFIFAIMLLNLRKAERVRMSWPKLMGGLSGVAVFAILLLTYGDKLLLPAGYQREPSAEYGTVKAVGSELFTRYLLPFEAASILLLIGIVGAVLLAKRIRT